MRYWIISLLLFTLSLSSVFGQGQISVADTTPHNLITTYYSAINDRDYNTAYSLWSGTAQTFRDFVAGFADTVRVEPYIGDYQPSTTVNVGRVPAVLVAKRTDELTASFVGCFHIAQNASGNWRIVDSDFVQLPGTTPPLVSTIQAYMGYNCYGAVTVTTSGSVTGITEAEKTLRNYFGAINAEQFDAAYAMWLYPVPAPAPNGQPATDYRTPYATFAPGYSNTEWVHLYVGNYVFGGGAAGKPYLDGIVPVALVAQEAGGNITTYSGCVVMGRFYDGRMGIVNAEFAVLQAGAPTGQMILNVFNTNCLMMGIPS